MTKPGSRATVRSISHVVAADIGGTFTDILIWSPDGRLAFRKVLSTPHDYGAAIIDGLRSMLSSDSGITLREVCHGTTIGTNAVIERKGAVTALITTRGFKDVLEIRRLRFPDPFNVQWEKPAPLVAREMRFEVTERVGSRGEIVADLVHEDIDEALRLARDGGCESIAVCLINSYVNPIHEREVQSRAAMRAPDSLVTISSDLLPEMGEYERTSTAVANAYLAPLMSRYLSNLRVNLDALGHPAPLHVAQSSGGLFLHTHAIDKPFLTLESGPAAGCIAAREVARASDIQHLLAVDMGGTTTKASFIQDGELEWASEFEIGSGVSHASRLLAGGGYAIRCPVVDLAEVGAGGGSIAWVDAGGLLHVGPESAGADPGPACYNRGGDKATLTDANVVLGYINPRQIAGGTFAVSFDQASDSVGRIAADLGASLVDAAFGIHTIANAAMMSAIRAVSTQRGRDLRRAEMLVSGGSGPLQAVGLASALGIEKVVVPPLPGLFSALGLLLAPLEHHHVQGWVQPLRNIDLDELNARLRQIEVRLQREIADAADGRPVSFERWLTLKVGDRSGELSLPVKGGRLAPTDIADLRDRFYAAYEITYRHRPRDGEAVLLRVRVAGRVSREIDPARLFQSAVSREAPVAMTRRAYFGPGIGYIDTPLIGRSHLGNPRPGPLIVEEADSSTVVHPGWTAECDRLGNIVLRKTSSSNV